jgi:hypothetical protein
MEYFSNSSKQTEEIAFEYKNGEVKFTVPEVDIHAMVVIE